MRRRSRSPRNAANPASAILSYLYAMLETEARIAALTGGLVPGIGFLHMDQRGRDSLTCDLDQLTIGVSDHNCLGSLGNQARTALDHVGR